MTIGSKLSERQIPTKDDLVAYLRRTRNWGRWGADDQKGALNLITHEKRTAAARLVKTGRTVSLSREFPKTPGPANATPAQHYMTKRVKEPDGGVAADFYGVAFHGPITTHLDALSHIWDGDGMWQGRDADAAIGFSGAAWGGVEHWREGIITRGVLLDVPAYRREPFVTETTPVHGWELADIARAQGVQLEPGDALLVYSGREAYSRVNPAWSSAPDRPGLDATCLPYIRENDIAVLVWDMTDRRPNPYGMPFGVHSAVFAYGVALVDSALLEPLAQACAAEGRYEFMLVVSPLVVIGGTGSPVNPLAVF